MNCVGKYATGDEIYLVYCSNSSIVTLFYLRFEKHIDRFKNYGTVDFFQADLFLVAQVHGAMIKFKIDVVII